MSFPLDLSLIVDGYRVGVTLDDAGTDRVSLKFPFNKSLIKEVKESFSHSRWNPDRKFWTVRYDGRTRFLIDFLSGYNPYTPYEREIPRPQLKLPYGVKPYPHQTDMTYFMLERKQCIVVGEMGVGKTLSAIIALMNMPDPEDAWFVAPNSALASVQLEFDKWRIPFRPRRFVTYSQLNNVISSWKGKPPRVVIFDESSRVKNPEAIRSKAAYNVAEAIRDEYGSSGYVILMSGTPAPKNPTDWWMQCEIACPGFLYENNIHRFRERLAVMVKRENKATSQMFNQVLCWKDGGDRCITCGKPRDYWEHDDPLEGHFFQKVDNEVDQLSQRLVNKLVIVKTKKDLNLPPKVYREINVPMSVETKQMAQLIANTTPKAALALILLRQLSDGFQYSSEVSGHETCDLCKGSGKYPMPQYTGPEKTEHFLDSIGLMNDWTEPQDVIIPVEDFPQYYTVKQLPCPNCNEKGQVPTYTRATKLINDAKITVFKDILEEHEDQGRIVAFGGFHASIDLLVETVRAAGWRYIRLDGRGWSSDLLGSDYKTWLKEFQSDTPEHNKVAFIGHPGSAGMGLTLHKAQSIVYYSNDFNGESREQSEDRIHRLGMTAANIWDLIHLPTDKYVLKALKEKKRLQDISMGVLREELR